MQRQKRSSKKIYIIFLFAFIALPVIAQPNHGDNEDGTFTNPVIAADFSDPDVIFVDDTYYIVSTTTFVFPGVTILKSKDLANWELDNELCMRFSLKIFTGNKFCLFNYATQQLGGYVGFDWFRIDATSSNE